MSTSIPNNPQDFSFEPAGALRLLPSVSFATRAAALAGAALPVAMLAAAVVGKGQTTGVEHVAALNTTCCPPPAS
ncbi:hypothetical protein [Actinokineospora bangkokensis]|uniref:Uncharacterized protein n=1 Tax=Actinokineospora bangkokensis TaxID=1193682 RepID=A0A1Q9LM26_9PSEU|nr:hypothetical protein [Actinokineospora bangkokensis]OLR93071.1 hypothetical protein BJP25_19160 [Actinokineospora bangkokensis]